MSADDSRTADKDPAVWLKLLDDLLPPIQNHSNSAFSGTSIQEITEILLAAQKCEGPEKSFDLLYILGFERGDWPTVVWLVKRIVEVYGAQASRATYVKSAEYLWKTTHSLDAITGEKGAVDGLLPAGSEWLNVARGGASLDELTADEPDNLSRQEIFAHSALGQVWRSLGQMTIACVDTEMKPEVLELIAFLHHMGMMPLSIYNQKPTVDPTAIQQPLMLSLLSSRMLISLSDAALRARARSAFQSNDAQDGRATTMAPGSRYRVNVDGLRPEAWLESLLWASLHGGWVAQGCEILRSLYYDKKGKWKPISWRSLVPQDDKGTLELDRLEHAFNSRRRSSMHLPDADMEFDFHRTISSEVVNAYVDALASSTNVGVGERGIATLTVLGNLIMLRHLLDRSNLSLGAGSWDAIILRLFDTHETLSERSARDFEKLMSLSPPIGKELDASSSSDVPDYVFDGSAAITGLYHRAIRARIHAGDGRGALLMLSFLQERADKNKRQSLIDFLQQQRSGLSQSAAESGMFTSNFSGISYPAFDMQMPPTLLAQLLEVALDGSAKKFARELLYSHDIDGPLIPQRLYPDPAVAPALIRYASEMNDEVMLSKVIKSLRSKADADGTSLSHDHLLSFFRAQVERRHWGGAGKFLNHLQTLPEADIDSYTMSYVAAAMIEERAKLNAQRKWVKAGNKWIRNDEKVKDDVAQGEELFNSMLQMRTLHVADRTREDLYNAYNDQQNTLMLVLAYVDPYWNKFLPDEKFRTFDLQVAAFNHVLKAVASNYDAGKARKVVNTFWPDGVKRLRQQHDHTFGVAAGEPRMPRFESKQPKDADMIRSVVDIATQPPRRANVYGGLQPDVATISIVLRAAIEESLSSGKQYEGEASASRTGNKIKFNQHYEDLTDMIMWAIRSLRWLGLTDEDIMDELESLLMLQDLTPVRAKLPDLVTSSGNSASEK